MDIKEVYEHSIEKYRARTPLSAKAFEEAQMYLAGGECRSIAYFYPYPFTLDHSSGCVMYDVDGNEYYDFLSNYTSLIHGHAHPDITRALCRAAKRGTISPAGIEEQVQLAKMITERVNSVERIRFCNSGTEATMFAIRTARAYKQKSGVIKMLGGYHGTHDAVECSISPALCDEICGADQKPKPEPGVSAGAMQDVYIAPYNNLDAVENILKNNDDIACIIVEPFMGTTGMIPARPSYLQGLRDLSDKYDVVLIIDEVQAFRLSTGGAQKKYGVDADLCTFGKFIGGGLSVGAFGGKKEIMAVFDHDRENPMSQSGTFNGNRVAMAGGIEALKLLDQKAIDYIDSLAERLEKGFRDEIKKRNLGITTTREGSLLNVHFMSDEPYDYVTAYESNKTINKIWYLEMLTRGIFPAPRGLFVISTVMDEKVIDAAIDAFGESLDVIAPLMT